MQAHVQKQIEKMSKVMIGEIKVYRKDQRIPSLLKMWPRKQFNYDHFMLKIEDVWKMVGCNGMDRAIMCTWQSKFRDANEEKKRGECLVSTFISC